MFPFSFKEAVKTLSWPLGRDLQYSLFLNQFVVGCINVSHFLFCFVLFCFVYLCVCVFLRENFKSCHEYILREGIRFRENAKISAVTQFSRYLFSARSYVLHYVYHLVCLCFGIFGVKYFAYN